MSTNPTQLSQLSLPQSTTTVARTPPLSSVLSPIPTLPSLPTVDTKEQVLTRAQLELYYGTFGNEIYKQCTQTKLLLTPSLNYSLHKFLKISDPYWVLAIIETYGQSTSKSKIIEIGMVIHDFRGGRTKLKAFRCDDMVIIDDNDDDDAEYKKDLFGLLMYCHPQLNKSHDYILRLIENIKQETNEIVNVGIAKMNECETYKEWKQRALKNL